MAALVDGADYAKGTRFADGGGSKDITAFRAWGNRGLNGLVNVLFRASYTDLCYGYNAFWTRILPILELPPVHAPSHMKQDMWWGDGFEIETLINIRVAEAGVTIREVGSVELARLNGTSNLNAVSDGIRVLRTALQERRYRRMRATARSAAQAAVQDAVAQLVARYRFVEPDDAAPDNGPVSPVIDLRAALANRSDNTSA